jgi:hypothetical protein
MGFVPAFGLSEPKFKAAILREDSFVGFHLVGSSLGFNNCMAFMVVKLNRTSSVRDISGTTCTLFDTALQSNNGKEKDKGREIGCAGCAETSRNRANDGRATGMVRRGTWTSNRTGYPLGRKASVGEWMA